MNIFDYFFSCFSYIIGVLNHDFFHLGFTYLDFILASSIIFIVIKFLLQGLDVFDGNKFFSFSSIARDVSYDKKMSNREREKDLAREKDKTRRNDRR
jgi:hypothetical protein